MASAWLASTRAVDRTSCSQSLVLVVHVEWNATVDRWECGEYTLLTDFPASHGTAQSVWYTTLVQHQLSTRRYSGVYISSVALVLHYSFIFC